MGFPYDRSVNKADELELKVKDSSGNTIGMLVTPLGVLGDSAVGMYMNRYILVIIFPIKIDFRAHGRLFIKDDI